MSVHLALDTSSNYLAVALWGDDGVRFERTEDVGRDHAARLPQAFASALDEAGVQREQLTGVTVGIGPGSYTGIRVGVAATRGLAFALGIPLHGTCSLAMVAAQAGASQAGASQGPVRVLRDARRGRVYAAEFAWQDGTLTAVRPPFKAERADLDPVPDGTCVVEDGPPSALWAASPHAIRSEPTPNYLE